MAVRYQFVTKSGAPAGPELQKFMTKVRKDIAKAKIELPRQTKQLAKQTARFMAQRVRMMTKRKGATGELALALEESVRFRRSTKNNFTITVGDTALLPPYWAMINYGGYIKSGFVPGLWSNAGGSSVPGSKGRSQFGYAPGVGAGMKPMKPIKGFQYIAYAHVRMLSYVRRKFNIFKNR